MTDLRFPIGKFTDSPISPAQRQQLIDQIAELPRHFRAAVNGLTPQQIETPYRPEGWTVRQLVHHVPESHMNAYIRCKLALTETKPTIKPYMEDRWANLADVPVTPLETSLALLELVHARWVTMLRLVREEEWARTFIHPENGERRLDQTLAQYAWHGRHHTAHVTALRERMGW